MFMIAAALSTAALADEGCTRDGVMYDSKGAVAGCEDGGNWCAGSPAVPGICDGSSATVPREWMGRFDFASEVCRGSGFTVHSDRVEYRMALEPLGTGRIVWVSKTDEGHILVRTILEGRGGYLRLWPSKETGQFEFGFGKTAEASSEAKCQVVKTK